jgi:hypothetical protein
MGNRYLDKIASNAYTQKYSEGTLSPDSLKRLQDSGTIRTPEQMAAGINRGSDNILKKEAPGMSMHVDDTGLPARTLSAKVHRGLRQRGGGYAMVGSPVNKVIVPSDTTEAQAMYTSHSPEHARIVRDLMENKDPHDHHRVSHLIDEMTDLHGKHEQGGKLLDSVFKRHEVYEASEKGMAKKRNLPILSHFYNDNGDLSGAHVNHAVIGRESNLVNKMVPASPHSDIRGMMTNLRNSTKETTTRHWGEATGETPYGSRQLKGKELEKLRSPRVGTPMEPMTRMQSLVTGSLKRRWIPEFHPKGQEPTYGDSPTQGFKEKVLGAAAKLKNQAANIAGKIRR